MAKIIARLVIILFVIIVVFTTASIVVCLCFPKTAHTIWYECFGYTVGFDNNFTNDEIDGLEKEFNLSFDSCEVLLSEVFNHSDSEQLMLWIKPSDKQKFFEDNQLNDENNIEIIETDVSYKNHKFREGENGILYLLYLPTNWSIYYNMTEYEYDGETYLYLCLSRFD